MCGQCDARNAVRRAAEKEARKIERQRKKALTATTSMFSLAESLGIDPNALVDACQTAGTSESLRHLSDVETAVDKLREYAVSRLRADNRTWAHIGRRLGTTAQAAHKRFRYLDAK